eukprot:gene3124-33230_t
MAASASAERRIRHLTQHLATGHVYENAAPDAEYATSGMPRCYFPSSQTLAVPVLAVRAETHISKVITFGLPPKTRLNLPVSSCLMMMHGNGSTARPYNPISPHTAVGSFQLLIKTYPDGTCSKYADYLKPGDVVQFKQLDVNVKPWQYPFKQVQKITMVAGGTGITPMIQALYA